MTHTPGPWHTDGTAGFEALEVRSNDRRIAKSLYHRGSEDREADANARLIAAAPDLLAACKAARRALQAADSRGFISAVYEIEQLEIAIAKARGRPPKKES